MEAAAAELAGVDRPESFAGDIEAMLSSLRLAAGSPSLGRTLVDDLREDFLVLLRTAERERLVTPAEADEIVGLLDGEPS